MSTTTTILSRSCPVHGRYVFRTKLAADQFEHQHGECAALQRSRTRPKSRKRVAL